MMRIFDPVVKRKSYIDFTLGFLQGLEFDPLKSMGNIAAVMISDVVGASLVGMSLDVVYVTPRALGWLDYAIENQETLGLSLNYHQFKLHRAKALGLWMQAGINSEETWLDAARAIFVCGRHDANVYPKNKLRLDYLDDYMSLCFQSGQYEQGVLEFEERSGSKNLNFLSLKRALKPREIGYLLCLT
ncbi:hypothetical protein QN382_22850 [Pseudomonas sp. 10B1]|uniref:hypothetical protein n=2 Tax=Pseudomonas TaxID=286 RepID=UPI002B2360AF|nr:hypothetical protein [Pseudomonas sp. AA4]MEB0089460.1 hypothetical protein [Pseudomonas sp. RTI1]MEB0155867.1 hypothetical protein [Pseudomonas sp. CCC4.3]MEB0222074.1 hypothetical protein [Pseudomonas sp. AB12(2023)]MEB0312096.1 hypothetical protein [Pseudomonas sp. 10B1]